MIRAFHLFESSIRRVQNKSSRISAWLWIALLGAIVPVNLAEAGGQTVTVWWAQGYFAAEDQAIREVVANWEKETGNRVNLAFFQQSELVTKVVAAITSGNVPDVCYTVPAGDTVVPQNAWNDKLADVSDVVERQKSHYSDTALATGLLYDSITHSRSYFGVPIAQFALHYFVWRPMIEEAGYTVGDIPTTWERFFDFFRDVQAKLRAKGERVYGLGYSLATRDIDSNVLFHQMLVAYGGGGIVTPDGRLHADDPTVRQAAINALKKLTKPYKDGFVPPGAINWGDPDNNSAFFAKQVVMTPNGSLSIPAAQMQMQDQYLHEILTFPQPAGPDGSPVASVTNVTLAFIPKGSRNLEGGKDFLSFLTQPQNLDSYLVASRGRFQPSMPSLVRDDPYWRDSKDPHRQVSVHQQFDGPTMPSFVVFNPAYAEVNASQVWGKAEAEVMTGGMAPETAVDKALSRISRIFARYPIPAD